MLPVEQKINSKFSSKRLQILHIDSVQIAVKPLMRKCVNASVLHCLKDARFKKFDTSILDMIQTFLFSGPIHIDCFSNLTFTLDDLNILKVLTRL